MSQVKVSVENLETTDRKLHEIDKTKSLEENITDICELFEKPLQASIYGLKLISTNDGKFIHSYISQDNINDIKNGYFLKLVYSVKHYVQRIFEHIDDDYKEQSFKDLYQLSVEPEFIKELVRTGKHFVLINHFTQTDNLEDEELTACLIAIVHLFQKGYINDISYNFLKKVISILKSPDSKPDQVKYALSVLHKILYHKNSNFKPWKEEIIKQIPLTELVPYIWSEDCKDLQYGALLLINTIIKCCKGDKRQQLIKEINLKQNREYIYTYVISPGRVDKNMAHELYVYQTYLLSLYSEALRTSISLNNNNLFSRDEFEAETEEMDRVSILIDFDDYITKNKHLSEENLCPYENDSRFSLASMSSKQSDDTLSSNQTTSTLIGKIIDYEDLSISHLTLEALRHYKRYHFKNFCQSQIEEKVYEPGIFVTAEKVTKMLAKILHIAIEPDRVSCLYQPTVFNSSPKTPFFLELFSITMWLLSKTRREMKATTVTDYQKVMNILEKQIKLILEEKPVDFKTLKEKTLEITYETVMKNWMLEKQEELNCVMENNPSVQVLKLQFTTDNEKLVFEQRMNYLIKGAIFPKIIEKKISGEFFAKLSENRRLLLVSDWNSKKQKIIGEPKMYVISNITHIVQGRACPHVKNNIIKDWPLAFSVVIDNAEFINFIAKDRKMASYWLDAFNLLLDKENLSQFYKKELADLVKMDLMLHLIELQNVTIPKKPPPIPPNPFSVRPPIPPKPKVLTRYLQLN